MSKVRLNNNIDSFAFFPTIDIDEDISINLDKIHSMAQSVTENMSWEISNTSIQAVYGLITSIVLCFMKKQINGQNTIIDRIRFNQTIQAEATRQIEEVV